MAIETGTRIGNYEILEPIGAGGMGKVYRAKDTKLGRDVAIKVLPEELAEDQDRIARFEREARLLASLNHPYIATLHGLDDVDGEQFLVMELVHGETLAERIVRGPIPIDEALPLFQQIAEGLEAAHDKGVVHRDLKPANIKLDPGGKPKILDFGLAKAFSGDDETPLDSSQSPTLAKGTALGVIMGTASYMSPEQARGKAVDKRADVWAFGCCLYEALTGKKAFEGETVTDTLAAVVKNEPEWERLPPDASSLVRFVLMQCLRKVPDDRTHDIADARVALSALEDVNEIEPRSTPERATGKSRLLQGVLAGVAAGAVAVSLWSSISAPRSNLKVVRFSVPTLEGTRAQLGNVITAHAFGTSHFDISSDGVLAYLPGTPEAYYSHLYWMDRSGHEEPFPIENRDFDGMRISPDGGHVALWESKGNDDVWIYDIARETLARMTSEWDNYGPFWSPDGESVFYTSSIPSRGAVLTMKAADGSGSEARVVDLGMGAFVHDLSPDGRIVVYNLSRDLVLLPLAETDQPVHFTESDFLETDARIAPDGRWIAYDTNESGQTEVVAQPFPEPGRRIPISSRGGIWPVWNPNGREIFYLEGANLVSVDIQLEPELRVGASRVLFERPNMEYFDVTPNGERFLVNVDNTESMPTRIEVVLNWFSELERLAPTHR